MNVHGANYCPNCGNPLVDQVIDGHTRRACSGCSFVDWNTWMNVAVVVIAWNQAGEFAMVRMKSQQTGTLTFPQGFRELGESLPEAAQREFREETGYQVGDLKLYDIYTDDVKRFIWVSFTGTLGEGCFRENEETSELILFKPEAPPPDDVLRGPLTRRLLHALLSPPVTRPESAAGAGSQSPAGPAP